MADTPKQINFTIVPDDNSTTPRTYANFCSIAHTPFDFTLTFCEVMPLTDKEIKDAESEHVVRAPEIYLVPRSSGKILVGATVEDVGFDKDVQPEIIQELHSVAARYLPELARADVTESWAGLRPGSPDDLPLIGPTEVPGIFVASGHFRNGILLAPITAQIVADLVTGKAMSTNISAFSPERFAVTKA